MTTKTQRKTKTTRHAANNVTSAPSSQDVRRPTPAGMRACDVAIPEAIWWMAVHRAAHAIAYVRLGLGCAKVSIVPAKCSEGVTATKYSRNQDFSLVDRNEIYGHFISLFEGRVAGQGAGGPDEPDCKMLGDDFAVVGSMARVCSDRTGDVLWSRAGELVIENAELLVALATRLCIYGSQAARELALIVAAYDGDEYASYQLDCLEAPRGAVSAVPIAKKVQ